MYRKPHPFGTTNGIVRIADGAFIPADPENADWQAYRAWRATGNAPAEPDAPESKDADNSSPDR